MKLDVPVVLPLPEYRAVPSQNAFAWNSLAIVFALIGIGRTFYSSVEAHGAFNRFDGSYAPGATANAVEQMANFLGRSTFAEWIIAALACAILARMPRFAESPPPPKKAIFE